MERSGYSGLILLFLVFVSSSGLSFAKKPVDKYRCLFFDSYIKGDMTNWPAWIEEMNLFYSGDFDGELVSLQAQYGLIGYYFGTRQKKKAREQVRSAYEQLDKIMEQYPDDARLHSLRGAFNAFKVALAVYKAPILGPRIEKSIQRAIELNSDEPVCWLENGNSLYNRPEIFGGDKNKAIESYAKSLKLFEKQQKECDYLKVLVEIFLIKGYFETKQQQKYKQSRKNLENKYGAMNWIDEFLRLELIE